MATGYTVAGVIDAGVKKPGVQLVRSVACVCKAGTRPGARPRKK